MLKRNLDFYFLKFIDGPDIKIARDPANFSGIYPVGYSQIQDIKIGVHEKASIRSIPTNLWHCIWIADSTITFCLYEEHTG